MHEEEATMRSGLQWLAAESKALQKVASPGGIRMEEGPDSTACPLDRLLTFALAPRACFAGSQRLHFCHMHLAHR